MNFTRRFVIKADSSTFRTLQWLGTLSGPMTVPELYSTLKTSNPELAKEITSRSRLARTLHFARMRALVTSGVWKESPVTASNPKRLHFRFALNHDNFALLLQQQQKMQEKQQTAQQQTAQ